MIFLPLPGHGRLTFYNAQQTIELDTKDGKQTTLLQVCKDATPPCRLNPLLFNGHLQTIWTVVKSVDIPIYYKRRMFEAEDSAFAGTFAVDFVVPPYQQADESLPPRTTYYTDAEFKNIAAQDSKPMVVVLHGLSGGSHEMYLRSVLQSVLENGWEACVVNSRGCAMSPITSRVLYNARSTWDIRQMVKWLSKTYPNRPLFGIGFSLGGNILVNVRSVNKFVLYHPQSESNQLLVRTVFRRRRLELCIESCCSLLQPMEPRGFVLSTATNLGRVRSIFASNGI